MSANADELPPELRPTLCPTCAYPLAGLPPAGVCPECGRAYDADTIVLWGWACGGRATVRNSRRPVLSIFTLFFGLNVALFIGPRPGVPTAAAVSFLVGGAILAWPISRRYGSAHPGLIQVRLSRDGCLQLDDLRGPSTLEVWLRSWGWTAAAAALAGAWGLRRISRIDGEAFGWCAATAIFFGIPLATAGVAHRRAARARPKGAQADAALGGLQPTPWSHLRVLRIDHCAARRFRLVAYPDTGWWCPRSKNPIDAEVICTAAQAELLRGVTRAWQQAAG